MKMGTIEEPTVIAPESAFQASVVSACHELLRGSGRRYVLLERFGLDVAAFISDGRDTVTRLLEVKVYAGGRPGGVGFGSQKGQGPQVDLLLHAASDLALLEGTIAWLYADATMPVGTDRYALSGSVAIQARAMGKVARGKQNNLRVSSMRDHLVRWTALTEKMRSFLL